MSTQDAPPVNEDDLRELKKRMKLIADADPNQYHNEFSLKRFLRAFKTCDAAFQVSLDVTFNLCIATVFSGIKYSTAMGYIYKKDVGFFIKKKKIEM